MTSDPAEKTYNVAHAQDRVEAVEEASGMKFCVKDMGGEPLWWTVADTPDEAAAKFRAGLFEWGRKDPPSTYSQVVTELTEDDLA